MPQQEHLQKIRSIGVIIGRFQIDILHEGHFDLINEVQDQHDAILIIVGLSPCKCTVNNPLDFDTRRRMLLESFPNAKIAYVQDMYDDRLWSYQLDNVIKNKVGANAECTLYGSRDSFIKGYHGKYKTEELKPRTIVSATKIREGLALRSRSTNDFRAGAIWAVMNQYPRTLPTVDIAVIDKRANEILLAKRDTENKYRIIGGFVSPGETYEDAAVRELSEEASIKATKVKIERSFFIDDWRYRSEVDKITTLLFTVTDFEGTPAPADDVDELAWMPINKELINNIVPNHIQMIEYIIKETGNA